MTGLRGYLLSVAVLAAFCAVASAPWWLDGKVVPWDAKNQFFPALRWLAARLEGGGDLLWMSEIFAGRPSLADPQSMVLSPGYLLLAAIDPTPSMLAADLLVLLELVLGGAALIGLARLRRAEPLAGLLAALVFAFGGSAMGRLQHVLLVQSYAFIPVVLLALEAAFRRPSILRGALAGLAVGFLAVGRDHVAFLGLFVAAGYAAFRWGEQPARLDWLRRALPAVLVAVLLAVIVALPPVLATLDFAAHSNRPAFDADQSGTAGLPPGTLLTLPIADYFGQVFEPRTYWGPGSRHWAPLKGIDRSVTYLYAGIAPVVLLIWLGIGRAWVREPSIGFAGAVSLIALIYALGNHTPLFALLHAVVPGVDLFRRPADASFALNLGIALAVLAITDRYLKYGLGRVPGCADWLGAALMLLVFAAAVAVALGHGRLHQALGPIGLAIGGVAAVAGLLLAGDRRAGIGRRWAVGAIIALTLVDLCHFTVGNTLNAQDRGIYSVLERPEDDELARAVRERMRALTAADGPARVELLGLGGPWQNMAMVIGVEDALGYNPVRDARYGRATGAEQNSAGLHRGFGTQMTGYRSPLADLLGIRLIVLGRPMEEIDPSSVAAFPPPTKVGRAWLYENPRAVPRVVLIAEDRVRPHAAGQTDGEAALPDLDWTTEALIDAPAPDAPIPDGPIGTARIRSYAPGHIVVDLDVARPSWLVVHELRQPGWGIRIDGQPRDAVPANGLFQAVRVVPGDSVAEIRYRPAWMAALIDGWSGR